MKRWMIFVLSVLCFLPSKPVVGQNSLYVDAAMFRCFMANIQEYAKTEEDGLVVVILENCPDPEITPDDISRLAVALDPSVQTSSKDKIQSVIALSGSEVACMTMRKSDILAEVGSENSKVDVARLLTDFCG